MKLKFIHILFGLYLICHQAIGQRVYSLPHGIEASDYEEGVIILKLSPETYAAQRQSAPSEKLNITDLNQKFSVKATQQLFKAESRKQALSRRKYDPKTDISNIYKVKLQEGKDVLETINELLKYENVLYAEPSFKMYPLYIPNDPKANPGSGGQDYLSVIKAYDGWNISKGDTSVVIGVLDSGIDPDHEDLSGNIAYNYADPIDNIDNDQDGYTDNFMGWDMADHDPEPFSDNSAHGVEVAGISSAQTGNETGIAGVGFKSRFLPVKIFTSSNHAIRNGYEAIVYAADHGCKVINLSWGSANSYTQYGQNIINYAVLEKDAVIVAAAGNTPEELDFYPASYDHVLSVGATKMNDEKASWATYSSFIDLMAPGDGIYTTTNDGYLPSAGGSSFSSPMVAGAAALTRAQYPNLTALQVAELLRITADDIYQTGNNASFQGKLGNGRLNVFAALSSALDRPALKVSEVTPSEELLFYDQQVSLGLTFTNYLAKTDQVSVTISTESPYVTLLNNSLTLEALNTLESRSLDEVFTFHLSKNTPAGEALVFRLDFEQGVYKDVQYIKLFTASNRLMLTQGDISADVYSNGEIGETHSESGLSYGGIYWKDQKILENAGLIVGTSETAVADNVVNNFLYKTKNEDFTIEKRFKAYSNSQATLDLRNVIRSNEPNVPLRIEQKILAWDGTADSNSFIVEYRITNLSDSDLSNVYAGLFQNWDIGNINENKTKWSEESGLGYTFYAQEGKDTIYAGASLLNEDNPLFYAIDKSDQNGNLAELGNSFSKAEKFAFLSSGSTKKEAGVSGKGNDVAQMLGVKINSLQANQSRKIALVFTAGNSLKDLKTAISEVQQHYADYLTQPPLAESIAICPEQSNTINPTSGEKFRFFADPLGQQLLGEGETLLLAPLSEDKIIFAAKNDSAYTEDIRSIQLKVDAVNSDFSWAPDTVYIDGNNDEYVHFSDLSNQANSWNWDFGNGYQSNVKNPVVKFQTDGNYTIRLKSTNGTGCSEEVVKQLVVRYRAPMPQITAEQVCSGQPAILTPAQAQTIKVYRDEKLETLLFQGSEWQTEPLFRDTVFYVTNADSTYESLAQKVMVQVIPLQNPDIIWSTDTLSTDQLKLNITSSESEATAFRWTINNKIISTQPTISYTPRPEEMPLIVQLESWNSEGCLNTLTKQLAVSSGSEPELMNQIICAGSKATFKPSNGSHFRFYADEALTELLHFGTQYMSEEIYDSLTIYITNQDSMQESKPVKSTARIFQLDFSISADTLYLPNENEVTLTASKNATGWQWALPNGLKSREQTVTFTVDQAGVYTLELVAYSPEGCQYIVSKPLVVLDILNADNFSVNSPSGFESIKLYPNPADDYFILETGPVKGKEGMLKLTNSTGQIVRRSEFKVLTNTIGVSVLDLPSGIYHLQLISRGQVFHQRVIIKK